MSKCGCGRSPTGLCKGWHGLSKEEYKKTVRTQGRNQGRRILIWIREQMTGKVKLDCSHHLSPIGCSGWVYDPQHPFIKEGRERTNGCGWSERDTAY